MAAKITRERAHHLLRRSFAFGDRVIDLGAGRFAVTSSKGGNAGYLVTDVACECNGFRQRGECRHFVRVAWERQGRPVVDGMAETEPAKCAPCEGTGKRRYWTGDPNGWVYPACAACDGTGRAA